MNVLRCGSIFAPCAGASHLGSSPSSVPHVSTLALSASPLLCLPRFRNLITNMPRCFSFCSSSSLHLLVCWLNLPVSYTQFYCRGLLLRFSFFPAVLIFTVFFSLNFLFKIQFPVLVSSVSMRLLRRPLLSSLFSTLFYFILPLPLPPAFSFCIFLFKILYNLVICCVLITIVGDCCGSNVSPKFMYFKHPTVRQYWEEGPLRGA